MLRGERVLEMVRDTRFTDLRVLDRVDSTNRVVKEAADAGTPEGLVVVADHQTAGRGRLGRTWEAPPGTALLVSILLRPDLAPADAHLVTAAVGLAARAACETVAGVTPELKWPNDLLLGDAKLAGILAEGGPALAYVVVGMGLNVSAAPDGAARLADGVEPEALLAAVLGGLEDRLAAGWAAVADEYRSACATVGRRVRLTLGSGEVIGSARALDDHGRLIVDPDDGGDRLVVGAGDVTHLRPAPGDSP